MEKSKGNFLSEINNKIENQKANILNSLEEAKAEREKYKDEIRTKQKEFKEFLSELNNIKTKLEAEII